MKPPSRSIKNIAGFMLLGITAIVITITGILVDQSFFRILPLYISLFVSLLQARANRYAPLIGSVNSLLYAAVYYHYRLYASMAYAALFSFTIQLVTFIRWNRSPYKSSTIFRKLTARQRMATTAGFTFVWLAVMLILSRAGSDHRVLDTTISLVGILASLLAMLSYIEYVTLTALGQVFSLILYISMLKTNPEQLTYLVYSLYSLICIIQAFIRTRGIYAEQQSV